MTVETTFALISFSTLDSVSFESFCPKFLHLIPCIFILDTRPSAALHTYSIRGFVHNSFLLLGLSDQTSMPVTPQSVWVFEFLQTILARKFGMVKQGMVICYLLRRKYLATFTTPEEGIFMNPFQLLLASNLAESFLILSAFFTTFGLFVKEQLSS